MEDPFTPTFFRRLQKLKIRTRRAFLGSRQGTHRSLRKGHGLEFADFRAYSPGDDYRHIDWGVYGRTDRVYVRQFREEQDLNVIVLLDSSRSMGYPEEKFEMARHVALALGYVALTDGDTVTFTALGQRSTPKFVGPAALGRARAELERLEPEGSFDMLVETRAAVARQRIPGKCFLISDFMFALESQFDTLRFLRARNFDVSVVQVLAPSELSLSMQGSDVAVDSETGVEIDLALDAASRQEYSLKLASHIEALEQYCSKNGISHVLISSSDSVSDVVLTRFPEVGMLR